MYRCLCVVFSALLMVGLAASTAWAQPDAWPMYPLDGHSIDRGPGGYFSGIKLFLLLGIFLAWVWTTDWQSQDCQRVGMPIAMWTPLVVFPFFVGFVLFAVTIPFFLIGLILFLGCYAGPLGVYIWKRNEKLPPHQKVMTPSHLRHVLADVAGRVGIKISTEKKYGHREGPPVTLYAVGGATDRDDNVALLTARQSPGYVLVKQAIADAIERRADRIMLDYAEQAVAVQYQIDGVWHAVEPMDRESGDMLLAVLKTLAHLNPAERRRRQQGSLRAEYQGVKYACPLSTQGTETGERAILSMEDGVVHFKTLDEIGVHAKMQERLKGFLAGSQGLFLFSSLPAGGLTTTMTVSLNSTDRFMRDFVELADKTTGEPAIENIELVTYDGAAQQTPASVLMSVLRKEPNVLVARDLSDLDSAKALINEAGEDRLVIGSVRAKEAVEALLRVLAVKVPPREFAKAVIGVLNLRLIRRLCDDCKEAYAPPPELLAKLGLPADRVPAFHRPPQQPEETCETCGGIGFKGRTAIFELLVVNDALREGLIKEPKLDTLRKLARKGGHRSLQEEGIILVAKGITSLPELQRVLKQ